MHSNERGVLKKVSNEKQPLTAILGDISYPWQRLVTALLNYLQITHLNAGYGEIRNLEFDGDRFSGFCFLCGRENREIGMYKNLFEHTHITSEG